MGVLNLVGSTAAVTLDEEAMPAAEAVEPAAPPVERAYLPAVDPTIAVAEPHGSEIPAAPVAADPATTGDAAAGDEPVLVVPDELKELRRALLRLDHDVSPASDPARHVAAEQEWRTVKEVLNRALRAGYEAPARRLWGPLEELASPFRFEDAKADKRYQDVLMPAQASADAPASATPSPKAGQAESRQDDPRNAGGGGGTSLLSMAFNRKAPAPEAPRGRPLREVLSSTFRWASERVGPALGRWGAGRSLAVQAAQVARAGAADPWPRVRAAEAALQSALQTVRGTPLGGLANDIRNRARDAGLSAADLLKQVHADPADPVHARLQEAWGRPDVQTSMAELQAQMREYQHSLERAADLSDRYDPREGAEGSSMDALAEELQSLPGNPAEGKGGVFDDMKDGLAKAMERLQDMMRAMLGLGQR